MLDAPLDPIRRHVEARGFELVDLKRSGPPDRPCFHLRIDRAHGEPGRGVTAGDCVAVSRSLRLELLGLLPGADVRVDVSSPGIERPVRFPEHWRRYIGRTVMVRFRTRPGHPKATILAVPDELHVVLRFGDQSQQTVALADLREARLVEETRG